VIGKHGAEMHAKGQRNGAMSHTQPEYGKEDLVGINGDSQGNHRAQEGDNTNNIISFLLFYYPF
jgi:hypothetical protein